MTTQRQQEARNRRRDDLVQQICNLTNGELQTIRRFIGQRDEQETARDLFLWLDAEWDRRTGARPQPKDLNIPEGWKARPLKLDPE